MSRGWHVAGVAVHPGFKPNLEWLAVREGVKPACRLVASAAEAERIAEVSAAAGLVARVTEAAAFIARFGGDGGKEAITTIVHVARSAGQADAAAAAERAMIAATPGGEHVPVEPIHALGLALGYPPCCVDTFLAIRDLKKPVKRAEALARTPGDASALLDDLDEDKSLISHTPCCYDCAPSVAYAAAVLDALRCADPPTAERLRDSLGGALVLFRSGGALRLAVSAQGERWDLREVRAFGHGGPLDAAAEALRGADAVRVEGRALLAWAGEREVCRLSGADVVAGLFR